MRIYFAFVIALIILSSIALAQTGSTVCTNTCGYASYGNGYYKAMCWPFAENTKTFSTPSGTKTWHYAGNANADNDCKAYWDDPNSRCFCEGAVKCFSDNDCGDGLGCTIGHCHNAGTASSFCDQHPVTCPSGQTCIDNGGPSWQCVSLSGTVTGWKGIGLPPMDSSRNPPRTNAVWMDYLGSGSPSTNANPYTFSGVPAGTWRVHVAVPAGWAVKYSLCSPEPVNPNDAQCHKTLLMPGIIGNTNQQYEAYADVSVPANVAVGVWWHFTPPTTTTTTSTTTSTTTTIACGFIKIFKFDDPNANGVWEQGEATLPGFTFTLSGPATLSKTTRSGGVATTDCIAIGQYTVTELVPNGWQLTTQNNKIVHVSSGILSEVRFGNRQVPTATTTTSTTTTTTITDPTTTTSTTTTTADSTTSTTSTSSTTTSTTTTSTTSTSTTQPSLCSSECSFWGQRECSGNDYRICGNFDLDNCFEWSSFSSCSSGQLCVHGFCFPSTGISGGGGTVANCTNECSSGERRCNVNNVEACGNFDSDSCLEWGIHTYCPSDQTCRNNQCSSCIDECGPQGLTDCDGPNIYMFCGNFDADPCNEWLRVSCARDEVCSGRRCVQTGLQPTPPSAGDLTGIRRTITEQPIIQAQAITTQQPADSALVILIVLLVLLALLAAFFFRRKGQEEK